MITFVFYEMFFFFSLYFILLLSSKCIYRCSYNVFMFCFVYVIVPDPTEDQLSHVGLAECGLSIVFYAFLLCFLYENKYYYYYYYNSLTVKQYCQVHLLLYILLRKNFPAKKIVIMRLQHNCTCSIQLFIPILIYFDAPCFIVLKMKGYMKLFKLNE